MDSNYRPDVVERRTIYGLVLEQMRNDAVINTDLFANTVTASSKVNHLHKNLFCQFVFYYYYLFIFWYLSKADPQRWAARFNRRHYRSEIHAVEFGVLRSWRPGDRHRSWPTVAHPLHETGRRQGQQLVAASPPARSVDQVQEGCQTRRHFQRHRQLRQRNCRYRRSKLYNLSVNFINNNN